MRLLYDYAFSFVGVPYKYGGQSPAEGLDCSALVRWLLKAGGITLNSPANAQGIYDQLWKADLAKAELGALVFYGKSRNQIDHVAFCLDEFRHIEAAGGVAGTVSLQIAVSRAAFVRVTPVRRDEFICMVMPDFPFKELP